MLYYNFVWSLKYKLRYLIKVITRLFYIPYSDDRLRGDKINALDRGVVLNNTKLGGF